MPGADEFFSVLAGDLEVARAHLDLRTVPLGPWPGVPEPDRPVVRLQLLEVASGYWGRGIGRATVDHLRFLHPGTRLAAVSVQGAAGFWEALGWDRFEHRDGRGRLPLYLAPDSPSAPLARPASQVRGRG
ncbi:Acetyltransferase (GNAT) family protein [Glycomyces sambucus]|uniref:Acetyltransferase (GNAT) family protein n=1 Tax=Glycomyces sambucus TaxID=380244 RepID=A0A1G9CFK7_9ACTN|nr:Acetyltransferase (GNAT) family protein [Glycomyces sambucus]